MEENDGDEGGRDAAMGGSAASQGLRGTLLPSSFAEESGGSGTGVVLARETVRSRLRSFGRWRNYYVT